MKRTIELLKEMALTDHHSLAELLDRTFPPNVPYRSPQDNTPVLNHMTERQVGQRQVIEYLKDILNLNPREEE